MVTILAVFRDLLKIEELVNMNVTPRTPPVILGEILKDIRETAKVNQEVMGKHLGYKGATVITHIETGIREVRLWEFIEFCLLVKEKPEDVLTEYMKQCGEVSHIWPVTTEDKQGRRSPQNKRKLRK